MQKTLLANLKAILSHYRWRFLAGFLMLFISNSLLIVNPLVFRQAVLSVESGAGMSIWSWGAILVSIAFTAAFFKYWMRIVFISVSRVVEKEMRSKLFERIQSQSMAFYDRHGIGELLSRLTNDISIYRDVLGPGIMYPLFFITIVFPGLFALFSISRPLAMISLIPLLLIPLVNAGVRGQIYTLAKTMQKQLADMSNMVQEHFSAIRIIKSYVIEGPLNQKFRALCQQLVKVSVRLATYQGMLFPFFTFLTKVTTVALVLFSGVIIFKAWSELNTADFISFMWIQSYIFFPVLMLGWLLPVYERGRAAYDRLVEIYEEPIEVQDSSLSHLRIPDQADISFRNLTFTYPTSKFPALKGINLEIEGAKFTGVTGPIGAGKTTLFRLLNREYEIPKGMIEIAGRDIHDYPLASFQRAMITVEQVPFLFSKSIADNVLFGKSQASQEELELVARYADIHETVLDFPEQYDTVIGERGVTLSGGQKQRLAMARAFLVNRSILLLDDIFSAVDAATEKQIFSAMKENFVGKTVLLITHRVSILEKMDRVIYMSDGEVLEEGSPEELIKLNAHYAALVELQNL